MMKVIGFCMWFWFVGVAFMLFNGFSDGVYGSVLVSGVMTTERDAMTSGGISRKLKENLPHSDFGRETDHGGDVSLEDYRPFDPSPSSKASIKPGPIQHGTPLNPYIPTPKPAPPRPSDYDESP